MKNLVLMGMPCAGKTTMGKLLAKTLKRPFYDLDSCLEKEQGKTINQLCEQHGITYFRGKETELIKRFSQTNGSIISTGGGFVLCEDNIKALEKNSVFVFLHRTPQSILECGFDTKDRPLLQNREALFRLYQERLHLYKKYAHYIVGDKKKQKTLQELITIADRVSAPHHYCLIGMPVEHSLSPSIHRPVLETLCDQGSYELQSLTGENLESWTKQVITSGWDGFNVTMPHKQNIIKYLNKLDESAKRFGSVNTVVCKQGELIGYNTDADGFYLSLEHKGVCLQGKKVLFLGGGGVAKALVTGAKQRDVEKITVLVRNKEKVTEDWGTLGKGVHTDLFNYHNLSRYCGESDILVQCTPMGMEGIADNFEEYGFLDSLHAEAVVVDLIYAPLETELLRYAKNRGLKTANGLGMLIYQGLLADKLYLQADFDMERMYQRVVENLAR